MQIKSLKILIKHKKIELDQISAKLMAKKEQMFQLSTQKQKLQDRLQNIEEDAIENVAKALQSHKFASALRVEIKKIEDEMTKVTKEIEEIKSQLKEAFGQKEGLEKMLKKLNNQIKEKEIIQEGRLADESFMRNFIAR